MSINTYCLAECGQSDWKIVLGADAISSEQYAADELRHFLKESTGVELPIVSDVSEFGSHEIILGGNAHTGLLGFSIDVENLGEEGFVLRTAGDCLIIAGRRPRGTLYGVYEFLERYVGCRWFTPEVSRVPRLDTLVLPDIDLKMVPPLEYREVFYTGAFDGGWAARNRMNGHHHRLGDKHGGNMKYTGFVHTFDSLVPAAQYFGSHPEYFSMVDGKRLGEHTQLCLANEDVFAIALGQVRRWLADNPGTRIVSVSQNDCYNPCQCPACRETDEYEGGPSGSLIRFVNRIAEEIEKEYPGVLVDTLAYQYTRQAPRHAVPRGNVVVRLCSIECCFAHPLETCRELSYPFKGRVPGDASFADDIRGWSQICKRLYVWDYVTNFANYMMPFPNLRVLAPNVRFLVNHSVRGIFEEGNFSAGGLGEFAELRAYLLARLLWNPDADMEAEMTAFLQAYYGGGAASIRRYIDLLHDWVAAGGYHFGIYDPPASAYLDDGLVARSLQLLEEAAREAGGGEAGRRVAAARLPLEFTRLSRLPAGTPGREEEVRAFFETLRAFGVTEIKEGRNLEESEALLLQGIQKTF